MLLRFTAPRLSSERGMTLVELMAVVVIVGVLSGLALILVRGRPGLDQTSHELANQVREAARKAVTGGIVDQTEVDQSGPAPTARARVSIVYDANINRQTVTVEVRNEFLANAPPEAEWFEVSRHTLREGIEIYGTSESLVINAAGLGDAYGSGAGGGSLVIDTLTTPTTSGSSSTADIYFNPDGSVVTGAGHPLTLFVLKTGSQEKRMRVVTLPLQGQPLVFAGW